MSMPAKGEIFDAINATPWDAVNLIAELAGDDGSVLELGCGTGRILVPLGSRTSHAVGVDACEEMLATARAKTEDMTRVRWICADMRTVQIEEPFDVVFLSTDTLAMVIVPRERLELVYRAASCIRNGGHLLLAFANPSAFLPDRTQHFDRSGPVSGGRIRVEEERVACLATGVRRGRKRETFTSTNGEVTVRCADRPLAIVTRSEVAIAIAAAGLTICAEYGDFDRTPLSKDSPRAIFVARRQEHR